MVLTENDFILAKGNHRPIYTDFEITEEAPSNIALVKYWGKQGLQLPMNPSISFTLNKSKTITKAKIKYLSEPNKKVSFKFYFNGQHQPDFEPKIHGFFEKIKKYVPFITRYHWNFYSDNTFPHSSGIASSASGFAALAKIIINLEQKLFPRKDTDYYLKKASFLARLGSGSAARSIEHPAMIWGQHPGIENTSDLYAVPVNFDLHPVFQNFRDSIILVEKGQKKVSSTAGHQLMETHPFKDIRQQQAFDHILKMYNYLKTGDIENFIKLTEYEALTLHALMMTSEPNYILMQQETLKIIHSIRNLRVSYNFPVCFTLDAGANVHILYPKPLQRELDKKLFDNINCEIIKDYV